MKVLLMTCLVLINISCGKKNNSTYYQNTFKQDDSIQNNKKSIIKTIDAPNIELEKAYFTLTNDQQVIFKSLPNKKNDHLRRSLLTSIANHFHSERVTSIIYSNPSYLILNKKKLFQLNVNESSRTNITRYDQIFKITSSKPEIYFQHVQASIGSFQNILEKISLSKNSQEIEGAVTNKNSRTRKYKTSQLKNNVLSYHLVDLNPMHLILDDYIINSPSRITSYQKEKEHILKNHYELVLSDEKKTNIFYVPTEISFSQALKEIYNNQIFIDESQKIVNIEGTVNNFQNIHEINLDSTFIKLVNFNQQDIKENPQAGNSYAIVTFSLKEIQEFGKRFRKTIKKIKFNDLIKKESIRIAKKSHSNITIHASLTRKEYVIRKKNINAYVLIMKTFGIEKKRCSAYQYFKVLKKSSDVIFKNKFEIIKDPSSFNYNLSYYGKDERKAYLNVTSDQKSIEIKINRNPTLLTSGFLQHNCSKGIKNMIYNSFSNKPITFLKNKVPKYEYILNLKISERGIIF